MLPTINGIEVLMTIRQQRGLTSMSVLVTAGTATTPFDLRGFGPLRVLRKPFDLDALIPAAEKLINQTQEASQ